MNTTTAIPTRQDHAAMHNRNGACWLCSTQVPWWAAVRARHGLSEPPYAVPWWWR